MFQCAIPVWMRLDGEEDKLNRLLVFRETVKSLDGVKIRLAAADFYRLTVNGTFVGFGPARTAKGYARVDEYELAPFGNDGENEILVEVAGYCCKCLSTVLQDSFFCAEIEKNGEITHYTGRDFACYENAHRVRRVERFSTQRHFGEVYDKRGGALIREDRAVETVGTAGNIRFIARRVPYAACTVQDTARYACRGVFVEDPMGRADSGEFGTGEKENAYSFSPTYENRYGLFAPEEIEEKPYRYVGKLEKRVCCGAGTMPVSLSAGEWLMVDLDRIECGFLRFCADVSEECDVILAFSELCETEAFSFRRVNMQSVLEYKLPVGCAEEEAFEPCTFRHVAIFVKSGALTVKSVGYRTFERDVSTAIERRFCREEHAEIYKAALRTFAHNAVDIFTDCPSRERAGWLCDSYFTGRAEYFFYGETPVEDAFLENYVLFENDGAYPDGVLPMCYPSSQTQRNRFIPQWDMWYVLEVCEYLEKRRPDVDREIFRPSVMGVLRFLERYESGDGLLEQLPSWNFVEWSDANSWTWDVNYPTNFLYAQVLEAVAGTFARPELLARAEAIRAQTVSLSFNGELFVDHAVRNGEGVLVNEKHISEACQYYAILFGGIDLDAPRYAKLKEYVITNFETFDPGEYQFCPKNAFIGLYLRMNVLMQMGDGRLLAENLETFCLSMCRTTGTLWEYKDGKGSLDHGFASYVALTIPHADAACIS